MGLLSNISHTLHSISQALGLSRSSKSHQASQLHGPVGNYRGVPVQAIYVQSWHQPSTHYPGQAPATQLHQRNVYLVPPNIILNTGNASVSYLTGQAATDYLQNNNIQLQNAYHLPPNSTLHLGGVSVTNFSSPQPYGVPPLDKPPSYEDAIKPAGVKAPVTPDQSTPVSTAKTPDKPAPEKPTSENTAPTSASIPVPPISKPTPLSTTPAQSKTATSPAASIPVPPPPPPISKPTPLSTTPAQSKTATSPAVSIPATPSPTIEPKPAPSSTTPLTPGKAETSPSPANLSKPVKTASAQPILSEIFKWTGMLTKNPAGSIALPFRESKQLAEVEKHEQAIKAEITALRAQISNMQAHLQAEEGNTVNDDELSQVLQTTGLSSSLGTKAPQELLKEALKKIERREKDVDFAVKILINRIS